MPGSARKSGWNADRTEPFDFSVHYSISAFCMTSALSYKRLILHKGFSASAIGARRGRQHSKTARAHAGLRGAERPAPAAGARWPGRCRGRPCARTSRSGGPASALVSTAGRPAGRPAPVWNEDSGAERQEPGPTAGPGVTVHGVP